MGCNVLVYCKSPKVFVQKKAILNKRYNVLSIDEMSYHIIPYQDIFNNLLYVF